MLSRSRNRVAFAWTLVALYCSLHASHVLHSLGIHVACGSFWEILHNTNMKGDLYLFNSWFHFLILDLNGMRPSLMIRLFCFSLCSLLKEKGIKTILLSGDREAAVAIIAVTDGIQTESINASLIPQKIRGHIWSPIGWTPHSYGW
ncbi:hypothetical protein MLD38_005896 [Melastoma candidum]|uniref:Uncharacterized protein n=1 Tax=Melastoma candidum TaxID=119954 RepID=A0ACB9RKW2_9MYRT|nr:hypothetical protein MLD38_005896 [Melastoma candidum]